MTREPFQNIDKEKLWEIANSNTTRNEDGQTVITKNDIWREEK